jgi:hypothetical protein
MYNVGYSSFWSLYHQMTYIKNTGWVVLVLIDKGEDYGLGGACFVLIDKTGPGLYPSRSHFRRQLGMIGLEFGG